MPLAVGVVLTGVGIGLVAAGTVVTAEALAAVGAIVGFTGVVIHALRRERNAYNLHPSNT